MHVNQELAVYQIMYTLYLINLYILTRNNITVLKFDKMKTLDLKSTQYCIFGILYLYCEVSLTRIPALNFHFYLDLSGL